MRPAPLRLLVSVAALAGLTGCIGNQEVKRLRTAVIFYNTAFFDGDGDTAWGLLSARCRVRIPTVEMDQRSGLAGAIARARPDAVAVRAFAADVDDGVARVRYRFGDSRLNRAPERWVKEGRSWRNDGC